MALARQRLWLALTIVPLAFSPRIAGLVTKLVPAAAVLGEARRLAEAIAATLLLAMASDDAVEGADAFFERRWSGD